MEPGRVGSIGGTYVIPWHYTSIDYVRGAPISALRKGSVWSRHGHFIRVDGHPEIIPLGQPQGQVERCKRASKRIKTLMKVPARSATGAPDDNVSDMTPGSFTLTDGINRYYARIGTLSRSGETFAIFNGCYPKLREDLWVTQTVAPRPASERDPKGMVCFARGTLIQTESGPCPIQDIRAGMRIATRDNGVQEVCWTGSSHLSGRELGSNPHARPVRIRRGAITSEIPVDDLLVSPMHRILVSSREANTLFNSDEVLVRAGDLARQESHQRAIYVDTFIPDITYHHLMTERHEIIWANGLSAETFHPSDLHHDCLGGDVLNALNAVCADGDAYGPYARRSLSLAEAELLHFKS